ncbi:ribose 5-phosphate isomerase B [Clostridia bacterium]|nr:ribose 5-phosphate isomerase B [Clostridia bacterium]
MLAIASDHGGFELKEKIKDFLTEKGVEYEDFGTYTADSCDYPDIAETACRAVISGACSKGILICGTGVGISIAANKIRGIRAALCGDPYTAKISVRHNDANVLAMGGRVVGEAMAREIVESWLGASFEGGRHAARLKKIDALDCK